MIEACGKLRGSLGFAGEVKDRLAPQGQDIATGHQHLSCARIHIPVIDVNGAQPHRLQPRALPQLGQLGRSVFAVVTAIDTA